MENTFPTFIDDFSPGHQTKRDASMIPIGAAQGGQNVTISDGDGIEPRKGRELLGDADTSGTVVSSAFTFRLKDGTEIPVRAAGTVLEYYHSGTGDWENLNSSYTSGQPFGFREFNENDEFKDQLIFCNGIEPYSIWDGAIDQLNGAILSGATEVTVDTVLRSTIFYGPATASGSTDTTITIATAAWATDLWNDDFYVEITAGAFDTYVSRISATTTTMITFASITGLAGLVTTFRIRQSKFNHSGSLRIGTTDVAYTSLDRTTRFAGCTNTPAALDNAAVAQAVVKHENNPRGNILETLNGKMFLAGYDSSTIYVSKVFNATDFTYSSPRDAGEGDVIDFVEGGGQITGMGIQEDSIYVLKQDVIKTLTYTQDPNDLANTNPVIAAPLVGPQYFQGVFKVDNYLHFASAKGGIKAAGRVGTVDFVQTLQISDVIRPTVNDAVFDTSSGVYFDGKTYVAAKTNSDSTYNDVIFVYNFQKAAWDLPITGWPTSCFFVYDGSLYAGSSINKETYKLLVTDYIDDVGADETTYKAQWTSGYLNYGLPAKTKSFTALYVEGYISESTTLNVQIDYDYNGVTTTLTGSLAGTETDYILQVADDASLGTSPLGEVPFGAGSTDSSADSLNKFRLYFTVPPVPFYEVAFTFYSDGSGQRWKIVRFGPNAIEEREVKVSLKKKLST
mgnify:CR=1 FL=1